MHQHKTVAQILLILSIFNLVLAAPAVREIYDAHNDVAVPVPVVVRNMAAISKERRDAESDGNPSHSSPPPPDGSTPSNSLPPPPPDGSTPLQGSSPSDEPEPMPSHESPSPSRGPAALATSSPPGDMASLPVVPASDQHTSQHNSETTQDMSNVPASDQPAPVPSTLTSQHNMEVTHEGSDSLRHPAGRIAAEDETSRLQKVAKVVVAGTIILAITGGLLWKNRHNLRRETIGPDPDW